MPKRFPPVSREEWNLSRAHKEVSDVATWARQVGFDNVAPRLEWAARLLKEELNKRQTIAET